MNTRLSFTAGLEGGRTLQMLSENGIEESSDAVVCCPSQVQYIE